MNYTLIWSQCIRNITAHHKFLDVIGFHLKFKELRKFILQTHQLSFSNEGKISNGMPNYTQPPPGQKNDVLARDGDIGEWYVHLSKGVLELPVLEDILVQTVLGFSSDRSIMWSFWSPKVSYNRFSALYPWAPSLRSGCLWIISSSVCRPSNSGARSRSSSWSLCWALLGSRKPIFFDAGKSLAGVFSHDLDSSLIALAGSLSATGVLSGMFTAELGFAPK